MNSAYYVTSFYSTSFYSQSGWDYWFMEMWQEIRETHKKFLERIAKVIEYNPLPILMRAVNSVKFRMNIKQPCWSSRRWKSLT